MTLVLAALVCILAGFLWARERHHSRVVVAWRAEADAFHRAWTASEIALTRECATVQRLNVRLAASQAEVAVAHARERARREADRDAIAQAERDAALAVQQQAQQDADRAKFAEFLEDVIRQVCVDVGLNRDLVTRRFDLSLTGKTHEVLHHTADRLESRNPVRTVGDVIAVFGGRIDAA